MAKKSTKELIEENQAIAEAKKLIPLPVYTLSKNIQIIGRKTFLKGEITKEEYLFLSKLNPNYIKFITITQAK